MAARARPAIKDTGEKEKKNKKKLSYNNDKTGKGGGRAHEKSISINPTAGNDLKI